jgi:1,4-alpha-glucan branching enzyme
MPSVLYDNARYRVGLEQFIADAGVSHFFVDTHLISGGQPLGMLDKGHFQPAEPNQLSWDRARQWGSVLEPVGVASHAEQPRCFAMGRHPRVSEQVWSGKIGYPGAGQYLEFHRKHGERGLRYHKVTDNKMALSDKHPYYPDDVSGKLYEHSRHFCDVVRETLREYRNATGRYGIVVAPFDAELFGHWWFEGPRFLREVVLTLANDPEVKLQTSSEALWEHPADKVVRMPEGTWGEKGDHSVWINDRNRWMWEIEYRAEGNMLKMLHELPWRTNEQIAGLLKRAGRELLLLQASDWPFVVHTQGATDYGTQRFAGHATAFDRMLDIAQRAAAGAGLSELDKVEIADVDAHDRIFADIDLDWWK